MNVLEQQGFGVLKETMALRNQLMDVLTDEDLKFTLPKNPPLGELCRDSGELEQMYIDGFKTFKMEWRYRYQDPDIAFSVERLKAWYAELDAALLNTLAVLSDDDIANRPIVRGGGFAPPVRVQFHIYRESLLIFGGKVSCYLFTLDKHVSEQWDHWIG